MIDVGDVYSPDENCLTDDSHVENKTSGWDRYTRDCQVNLGGIMGLLGWNLDTYLDQSKYQKFVLFALEHVLPINKNTII